MLARVATDARSTRLVALLVILCVLHACDWFLTHNQVQRGHFIEANLIAAHLVDNPLSLALYKLCLFGSGAVILFLTRHHWQAELGAWVLLGISVFLMVWWVLYLECVNDTLAKSALLAGAYPL